MLLIIMNYPRVNFYCTPNDELKFEKNIFEKQRGVYQPLQTERETIQLLINEGYSPVVDAVNKFKYESIKSIEWGFCLLKGAKEDWAAVVATPFSSRRTATL